MNFYKEILEDAFSVDINMNDVFYWACADAESIDPSDLELLEELCKKHGTMFTIWAYVTVKRSFEDPEWLIIYPQQPVLKNIKKNEEDFDEVRSEVLKLVAAEEILYDEISQKKRKEEEIAEFGEPINRRYHQKIKGLKHAYCIAELKGKELAGIGRNMHTAIESLRVVISKREKEQ